MPSDVMRTLHDGHASHSQWYIHQPAHSLGEANELVSVLWHFQHK